MASLKDVNFVFLPSLGKCAFSMLGHSGCLDESHILSSYKQ